ncbi:uncharacterized protein LOC120676000 isoform X2 [Panicum virgatum]|uniref:uncharacterized protein LOC120676000 isoform X2 n=1 Tax=Panicum virgatum TaxID=38727 RepID=UPI0019D51E74|nr:uncharacterized protein LOC120676000 isoform X2 [Panicum virgatum]
MQIRHSVAKKNGVLQVNGHANCSDQSVVLQNTNGPMSAHVDHNRFESGIWEPEDIDDQNEEFVYKTNRDADIAAPLFDPFDSVYKDLPKEHQRLQKVPNCEFCGAIKFPGEGLGFCCRQGKVNIFIPDVPNELQRLFTSQTDKDALYFRQNIRYFNSHFSFTSFGATVDRRLATAAGTGVYTFKVHGQIYHKLDQLRPGGKGPRHMQLYFYDTDESIAHRSKRSPHLDADLIRNILGIFRNNPYMHTFRSLGQLENIDEYKIEMNTSISVDQQRYNAPTMEQVAAIWQEGSDEKRKFDRSIMIYANSGRAHFIRAYYGCYDPLSYPVFYPNVETGWEDKKILLEEKPVIRIPR